MITALVTPNVFITNKGPFLPWPRGTVKDQAFLLGVQASLPLDWDSRRFVEIKLNYFIFNPMPVPRPDPRDPDAARVVALNAKPACPDDRFASWAE